MGTRDTDKRRDAARGWFVGTVALEAHNVVVLVGAVPQAEDGEIHAI